MEDQTGYAVLLDGKSVKTPERKVLRLPTDALADAIAGEWRVQAETIKPETMPLMRLATTVIDLLPVRRADAVEEVLGYCDSDMLCYRSERPDRLIAFQESRWDPVMTRLKALGAPALMLTCSLLPIEQSPQFHAWLKSHVDSLDDWQITALHSLTTVSGSVLLGIVACSFPEDVEDWVMAATANEDFEMEEWGTEDDAVQRRQAVSDAIHAACRFVTLL